MTKFHEPAMRRYLNDIGRHPLMTADEEIRCGKLVQEAQMLQELERPLTSLELRLLKRAERAKKRFVEANLRMVVTIAKKYASPHLQSTELLDLIQEGSLGLMRAVELYDPTRGYKFSTYAYWWIRQAMTRALGQKDPIIRLPHAVVDKILRMKKTVREETQRLGRAPTRKELAEKLDLSVDELDELRAKSLPAMSLDYKVGNDEQNSLIDVIADPNSLELWDEDMQLEIALNQDLLRSSLLRLKDREQELICRRYGLNGFTPTTLTKIADGWGVSRERVRQLLTKAQNVLKLQMRIQLQAANHIGMPTAQAVPAKELVASPDEFAPLGVLVPEHLPMKQRQALWSAPVPQHAKQPCAVSTAA